jgi:alpha-ketoglutaric semialdehyde dehydrogenase
MEIYRNLIGGDWLSSAAGERVANINPADRTDVLGEVPLSMAAEAVAAVEAAGQAGRGWRHTPPAERAAVVARAARLLAERAAPIAQALTREQGKLGHEAEAELVRAVALAEQAAALAGTPDSHAAPSGPRDSFGYATRRPLGVAALFSSWAEPAADVAAAVAAALVAGNTVVLKPASLTPHTAALVTQCFVDAGVPPGVLNLVYGSPALAAALVGHETVRSVWHAGGSQGAAELRRLAAARGIRSHSEAGGRGAAVVLEDADLDRAVAGVTAAAFGEAGQRPGAIGRVALAHPVADAFLEKLVGGVAAMQLGTELGPLVSEERLLAVLAHLEEARAAGAEQLYGGVRARDGALGRGFFVRPAVLDRCRPEMRAAGEPVFGPVLAVVRVEGFDEALAAAVAAGQPLATAAIYARDASRIFRFVDETDAAHVSVNAATADPGTRDMGTLIGFFSTGKTVSLRY